MELRPHSLIQNVALRWNEIGDFLDALPNTNIILAAYITAQARLKLYTLLEPLQEIVLYFNTDSVIYVHEAAKWNPPLGDFIGQLKDETDGVHITSFVSGGGQNYAYTLGQHPGVQDKGFYPED